MEVKSTPEPFGQIPPPEGLQLQVISSHTCYYENHGLLFGYKDILRLISFRGTTMGP